VKRATLLAILLVALTAPQASAQCVPDAVHVLSSTAPDTTDQVAGVGFTWCFHYHEFSTTCGTEDYRGGFRQMDGGPSFSMIQTGTSPVSSAGSNFEGSSALMEKQLTKHTCVGNSTDAHREVTVADLGYFELEGWVRSDLWAVEQWVRVDPSPPVPVPSSATTGDTVTVTVSFDGFPSTGASNPTCYLYGPATLSPAAYDYTGLPGSFEATFHLVGAAVGSYSMRLNITRNYTTTAGVTDGFWSTASGVFTVAAVPVVSTWPWAFGSRDGFGGGE